MSAGPWELHADAGTESESNGLQCRIWIVCHSYFPVQ
jgi:hypothetical protein